MLDSCKVRVLLGVATSWALDRSKLLGRFNLLSLGACGGFGSKRSFVSIFASDSFSFFNLHKFLDDAILQQLIDLILIYSLPILNELSERLFKLDLKLVYVVNLIIVASTKCLQDG